MSSGARRDGSDGLDGLNRRDFLNRLGRGVVATAAATVAPAAGADTPSDDGPRVRRYRTLGRTGLRISDISIGTGSAKDPAVIRHAFDQGITYFDTAESYPLYRAGKAELAIGQALAGVRDKVVLASKIVAKADFDRNQIMKSLEGSLRRLRTDRIDVYFNHAVNDLARLRNPEWFEFAEQAKKQGKIRFTGMSGHGGHLIECLDAALDEDRVDVILAAYNFGQDPAFYEKFVKSFDIVANQEGLPRVLAKAKAKGVGVVVMKTLMGGRLNDMRPYEWSGSTFSQAAFRWVLSNPNVDGLIVSMNTREHVDEYLGASGREAVSGRDLRMLREYAQRNGGAYCRPACNDCSESCPHQVSISEVLRARMYAADYGDPALARATYATLGAGASACLSCSGEPCADACPHGLDVSALTRGAARSLGAA